MTGISLGFCWRQKPFAQRQALFVYRAASKAAWSQLCSDTGRRHAIAGVQSGTLFTLFNIHQGFSNVLTYRIMFSIFPTFQHFCVHCPLTALADGHKEKHNMNNSDNSHVKIYIATNSGDSQCRMQVTWSKLPERNLFHMQPSVP